VKKRHWTNFRRSALFDAAHDPAKEVNDGVMAVKDDEEVLPWSRSTPVTLGELTLPPTVKKPHWTRFRRSALVNCVCNPAEEFGNGMMNDEDDDEMVSLASVETVIKTSMEEGDVLRWVWRQRRDDGDDGMGGGFGDDENDAGGEDSALEWGAYDSGMD
jgi:hypothetical protein